MKPKINNSIGNTINITDDRRREELFTARPQENLLQGKCVL